MQFKKFKKPRLFYYEDTELAFQASKTERIIEVSGNKRVIIKIEDI